VQTLIREIIKMSNVVDSKGIKVVGSDTETNITVVDEAKDLIVYVKPKKPIPDFQGTFGIPNLRVLDSLLAHEPYRDKGVEIERFTRKVPDANGNAVDIEVPKRMLFRDKKGGKAVFFFSHGAGITGADFVKIPWDMTLVPRKEAWAEFAKLSSIFITKECTFFKATVRDHNLYCSFGTESGSTHHGEMLFEEHVKGALVANLAWESPRLISIVKTIGARDARLDISNKGLLRMVTETELASYEYWLRCIKPS
jgi:hypothetical protein